MYAVIPHCLTTFWPLCVPYILNGKYQRSYEIISASFRLTDPCLNKKKKKESSSLHVTNKYISINNATMLHARVKRHLSLSLSLSLSFSLSSFCDYPITEQFR